MHWYATHDLPRHRIVAVYVQWDGWEGRATRVWQENKYSWYTHKDGERIELPANERWAPEPICWRPFDEATWGPLPEPLMEVRGGMHSSQQDFNAAEAAREMEADREFAAARGETPDPEKSIACQKWRDMSLIKYQPVGEIDPIQAEYRLMRALACSGAAGRAPKLKSRTVADAMAQIIAKIVGDDLDYESIARFQPLQNDHADFDTAMSWFAKLAPPEDRPKKHRAWSLNLPQYILLYRSLNVPLSFTEIAFQVHDSRVFRGAYARPNWKSAEGARQEHKRAVDKIWRISNNRHSPGVDYIAALRERNRKARRNG